MISLCISIHYLFSLLGYVFDGPANLTGVTVNQDYTTEELVRDVFLKAGCRNVSNVQAIGNELSVGYFSGSENVIGLSDGIIISSGDVFLAEGPNESVEMGATFSDESGDSDLIMFASNSVFDVGGISFDFVPIEETVTFRYVFASEEYCEYVGSIFNDIFGFFVSGPGIDGPFADNAINVALLPGTDEYVAINSVNHIGNAAMYVNNERPGDAYRCGIPYNPRQPLTIEYDGFTIPLTAVIEVIPCETYHIRLVVADVGDDRLDSAVFLESQSFDLGKPAAVRAEVEGSNDPIAVEGCRDGRFVFERPPGNFSQPLTINYTIGQGSDAVSGVDYQPIPGSVTIPAGQFSTVLPIEIIEDQVAESTEKLYLELEYLCECIASDTAILYIVDETPVAASFDEIRVCAGQPFSLTPAISNGAPPFSYAWETGESSGSISLTIDQPTERSVTVTDFCGSTAVATATIGLKPVPEATLSGEAEVCMDATAALNVDLEGQPPWSITYTVDGNNPQTLNNIFTTPYLLEVTKVGLYELTAFRDAYCSGETAGSGTVRPAGPQIIADVRPPSCPETTDGSIRLEVVAETGPLAIAWSTDAVDTLELTGLPAGVYTATVTDAGGCRLIESFELFPEQAADPACVRVDLYVPNAFSPNGDGFNDHFQLFPGPINSVVNVERLQIFNRWGAVVYEKKNFMPLAGEPLWDGSFLGRPLNTGLFLWQAVMQMTDGSTQIFSGEVMLMK